MPLFIYEDLVEKNVKIIASHTKRKIMAVVKSDAYGCLLYTSDAADD